MPASSSSLFGPAAKHAALCVAAPAWILAFGLATGSINLQVRSKLLRPSSYGCLTDMQLGGHATYGLSLQQ